VPIFSKWSRNLVKKENFFQKSVDMKVIIVYIDYGESENDVLISLQRAGRTGFDLFFSENMGNLTIACPSMSQNIFISPKLGGTL